MPSDRARRGQTERVGHRAVELDEIVLGQIREICARFDGVDEGALQERPLFRVGRRRFAIFNGSTSPSRSRWDPSGRSLHFLADPTELQSVRHDGRFFESPHHGSAHRLVAPRQS